MCRIRHDTVTDRDLQTKGPEKNSGKCTCVPPATTQHVGTCFVYKLAMLPTVPREVWQTGFQRILGKLINYIAVKLKTQVLLRHEWVGNSWCGKKLKLLLYSFLENFPRRSQELHVASITAPPISLCKWFSKLLTSWETGFKTKPAGVFSGNKCLLILPIRLFLQASGQFWLTATSSHIQTGVRLPCEML